MNNEKKIVTEILDCIESIIKNISKDNETIKSFRTRARDIPLYLFMRGPTYTMVYIAARSNVYILNKAFKASNCEELIMSVIGRDQKFMRMGSDKKGYALYGAVVIYVLKRLNLIKAGSFTELINETLNNPALYSYLSAISEWIKRFAEGYIEA